MANQTKIIAHRGASFDAPENTLESVQLAWEQNADAVEIDIQLTADGQIVVFHDHDTERMTGVSGILKEKTWPELQPLEINSKGYKTHIPLLGAILPTIPQNKFLVIEIKSSVDIVSPLRKLVNEFQLKPENVQFISLYEAVMHKVKELFPGYETQRVFEFDQQKPDPLMLKNYARQTPFDGIDIERGDYIDADFAESIHKFKKKVYIWTVNDAREAFNYSKIGIDGITTDRPGWMKKQLERANES